MFKSDVHIRRLTPEDAQLYRAIRLEALRVNPEAFGSTFEVESTHPLPWCRAYRQLRGFWRLREQ